MHSRLGQAGLAAALLLGAMFAAAPVAAQEPPPARPLPFGSARPPQPPTPAPLDDAGDLAGPELSRRPAVPGGPPPAGPGPEGGVPLRVVPPALPSGGATTELSRAVLTVDQEAMYRQSRWGLRVQAELAARSRQVAADNDRAFADLVADEDALTAARATLSPEEFRTRAAGFDERVMAVREEREAARNALAEMSDLDRALFAQAAAPVLGRLMTARGALVVLDQRTVLIADERIDVTAATIAALDAELGDGREIVAAALVQARAREEAGGEESAGAEPEDAPGGSATVPAGTALDLPEGAPAGAPAAPQDPR